MNFLNVSLIYQLENENDKNKLKNVYLFQENILLFFESGLICNYRQ